MKPFSALRRLVAGLAVVLPSVVFAHPGHDGDHGGGLTWDFSGGFGHPLSGLDHLLAMIAVGLWAAQLGGRTRWAVPATFVSVMALGAVIGHGAAVVPGVEQAIAASLLALGLLVATAKKMPFPASLPLTAAFAIFHGFAHGAEVPADASGLAYGAGFVAATALLHGAGVLLGQATIRQGIWLRQSVGAGIVAAGAVMLLA